MGWMVIWKTGNKDSDWDTVYSDYTRDDLGKEGVLVRLSSESGVGSLCHMTNEPDLDFPFEYRMPRTILDFINERLGLSADEKVSVSDEEEIARRFGGDDEDYLIVVNQIRNVILDHPEQEEFLFSDTYM